MESLLCDEVLWLSSPATTLQYHKRHPSPVVSTTSDDVVGAFHMTEEDCEQALNISLEEEQSYVPKPNYIQYLVSENLVVARFKIIQWFIKCRIRFNLSLETVVYAANYLDRFVSMNLCNEWKDWMVELVSVACLSIAAKFGETTAIPTLHEINQTIVEDVLEYHYLFEARTIERMEMVILKALDWRLACTTCHSYVQMFTLILNFKPCQMQIIGQLNHLLLRAISDIKMLEFRPSTVALSALWCCSDMLHDSTSSSLQTLLTQHQKDDLARCVEMMKMESFEGGDRQLDYHSGPSSPTTVLLKEHVNICDFRVDLCRFQIKPGRPNTDITDQSRSRKKPRNEDEDHP